LPLSPLNRTAEGSRRGDARTGARRSKTTGPPYGRWRLMAPSNGGPPVQSFVATEKSDGGGPKPPGAGCRKRQPTAKSEGIRLWPFCGRSRSPRVKADPAVPLRAAPTPCVCAGPASRTAPRSLWRAPRRSRKAKAGRGTATPADANPARVVRLAKNGPDVGSAPHPIRLRGSRRSAGSTSPHGGCANNQYTDGPRINPYTDERAERYPSSTPRRGRSRRRG